MSEPRGAQERRIREGQYTTERLDSVSERVAKMEGRLEHMATRADVGTIEGQMSQMATKADVEKAKWQIILTWLGVFISLLSGLGMVMARVFLG